METTPLGDWMCHLLKESEFVSSYGEGSNNVLTELQLNEFQNVKCLRLSDCDLVTHIFNISRTTHEVIKLPNLYELQLQSLVCLTHFCSDNVDGIEFPQLRKMTFSYLPEFQNWWPTANNSITHSNPLFDEKVSCPNLEKLIIWKLESINALGSHQLPTAYFYKLETLHVSNCGNLRNLMSPSVARGTLNLRRITIENCVSMEEVITEEEQQGEEIITLFPLLETLELEKLPMLRHFFLTNRVTEFPFLRELRIGDCPEMKTFVQQGISVSTPSLESVNNNDEVKVNDRNTTMFNSKVSCPNLEKLIIWKLESINALCSHQLPTAYFSKLETLHVSNCGNLRNLMSPSVARGTVNLQRIMIENYVSMEEVITEEEQQGEEIMTLFPLLEKLELEKLPMLRHFFLTMRVTEFPFLRELRIGDCSEMKTFVQQGISVSTPSLESVNNDDEVKVNDRNKAMFNSKVSCPNLEKLIICKLESINALGSHQLPTAYFYKLETLHVSNCGNLRNLMSPSVARGTLNLRRITIENCVSMEEVITEEEQQGEEIMTLFPLLEMLELEKLPMLRHFFLTNRVTEFPFLRELRIGDCPEMKTFVQQGISVSTPSLESVNNNDEVKVNDRNTTMFNSKVSCPNLEKLIIWKLESINALCSHQLPTAYFSKLETLHVSNCGNLRNLMSPSVARGTVNLQRIMIENYVSMEEVITEEEQQGEEIMTLFPLLKMLELEKLPMLRHFFLIKRATEFPFLREVRIGDCPEMKKFVQPVISVSTPSLESVNNDDEAKVVDLDKAMFNSKISCPSLEYLYIKKANSISALCSHQLPTAYFSKLETLYVSNCGKLRNLMSPSVARGLLNLRILRIYDCQSMEEVITKEEQQGERIMTLFPRLKVLSLNNLPKLGHFFLTEHALKFPFLREVWIDDCPQMKMFVQQGISVSTPSLECVNYDYGVKVDDLNKWTQQRFNSKEQKASQGTTNGYESEAIVGDKSEMTTKG